MTSLSDFLGQINLTRTDNGAAAHVHTTDALLDLFHTLDDNAPYERICDTMSAAWRSSPINTLRIVFYVLDVREGKAANFTFRHAMKWLAAHQAETFLASLKHVAFFGYYKDLPELLITLLADETEVQDLINHNRLNANMYGRRRCEEKSHSGLKYGRRQCCDNTMARQNIYNALESRSRTLLSEEPTHTYSRAHDNIQRIFADALMADLENGCCEGRSSLAAKWLPSEKSCLDRVLHLYPAVAKRVLPNTRSKIVCSEFRKTIITPLRSNSSVIAEVYMSKCAWNSIPYKFVPGRSMRRNGDAFRRHDEERFESFVSEALRHGGAGLHASTLKPNELVAKYMAQPLSIQNQLVEGQWLALLQSIRERGTLRSTLAIVDVSGSMSGTPMEVAISLGLLTSTLCEEPWRKHVLTFSGDPELFEVTGQTLQEQVSQIMGMPWGMGTNYIACFDLILAQAIALSVPPENMVEQLITISDMQFDASGGGSFKTSFAQIKEKYAAAGYQMPRMVFWNVASNSRYNVPVTADEQNTILLSGYSANMLKLLLEDSGWDEMMVTPRQMMMKAIGNERYDRLTLA